MPDEVESVSSASTFKRHLDGFSYDWDVYRYNYKANIALEVTM